MKLEYSELNDKLEQLEGMTLESLDKIEPLQLKEVENNSSEVQFHQIEYSSCGCYHSCGSEYSKNGKCSCYTNCGSNYSKG